MASQHALAHTLVSHILSFLEIEPVCWTDAVRRTPRLAWKIASRSNIMDPQCRARTKEMQATFRALPNDVLFVCRTEHAPIVCASVLDHAVHGGHVWLLESLLERLQCMGGRVDMRQVWKHAVAAPAPAACALWLATDAPPHWRTDTAKALHEDVDTFVAALSHATPALAHAVVRVLRATNNIDVHAVYQTAARKLLDARNALGLVRLQKELVSSRTQQLQWEQWLATAMMTTTKGNTRGWLSWVAECHPSWHKMGPTRLVRRARRYIVQESVVDFLQDDDAYDLALALHHENSSDTLKEVRGWMQRKTYAQCVSACVEALALLILENAREAVLHFKRLLAQLKPREATVFHLWIDEGVRRAQQLYTYDGSKPLSMVKWLMQQFPEWVVDGTVSDKTETWLVDQLKQHMQQLPCDNAMAVELCQSAMRFPPHARRWVLWKLQHHPTNIPLLVCQVAHAGWSDTPLTVSDSMFRRQLTLQTVAKDWMWWTRIVCAMRLKIRTQYYSATSQLCEYLRYYIQRCADNSERPVLFPAPFQEWWELICRHTIIPPTVKQRQLNKWLQELIFVACQGGFRPLVEAMAGVLGDNSAAVSVVGHVVQLFLRNVRVVQPHVVKAIVALFKATPVFCNLTTGKRVDYVHYSPVAAWRGLVVAGVKAFSNSNATQDAITTFVNMLTADDVPRALLPTHKALATACSTLTQRPTYSEDTAKAIFKRAFERVEDTSRRDVRRWGSRPRRGKRHRNGKPHDAPDGHHNRDKRRRNSKSSRTPAAHPRGGCRGDRKRGSTSDRVK